jgi:hypothetical protein
LSACVRVRPFRRSPHDRTGIPGLRRRRAQTGAPGNPFATSPGGGSFAGNSLGASLGPRPVGDARDAKVRGPSSWCFSGRVMSAVWRRRTRSQCGQAGKASWLTAVAKRHERAAEQGGRPRVVVSIGNGTSRVRMTSRSPRRAPLSLRCRSAVARGTERRTPSGSPARPGPASSSSPT